MIQSSFFISQKTSTKWRKKSRIRNFLIDIQIRDLQADYTVKCSARTGEGLEELKDVLAKILAESQIYLEELFSYKEAGKIQLIREYGSLLSEEYTADGIAVKARVPAEIFVSVLPESH